MQNGANGHWAIVTAGDGKKWHYNEAGAQRIVKRLSYYQALSQHIGITRIKDHWVQKIGLMGAHAEVDFDSKQVNYRKDQLTVAHWQAIQALHSGGLDDVFEMLVLFKAESDRLGQQTNKLFQTAVSLNNANIEAAEKMIGATRFTRDASIVGISVIATVATGGATFYIATAAAAAGSAAAKYQDTGDLKKSLAAGAFGLVPLGKVKVLGKAGTVLDKQAVAALSMVWDASVDTAKGVLVDEKPLRRALGEALVDTGVSGLVDLAMADRLAAMLGRKYKSAITIYDTHGGKQSNRLPSLIDEGTKTLMSKGSSETLMTAANVAGSMAAGATGGRIAPAGQMCVVPASVVTAPSARATPAYGFIKEHVMRPL